MKVYKRGILTKKEIMFPATTVATEQRANPVRTEPCASLHSYKSERTESIAAVTLSGSIVRTNCPLTDVTNA